MVFTTAMNKVLNSKKIQKPHFSFFCWKPLLRNPEFRKSIALDAIKKSLMFATEDKKLKSYPQEILCTHLPVILYLGNIKVKMYN